LSTRIKSLSEPGTIEAPVEAPQETPLDTPTRKPSRNNKGPYRVLLYNDDWHSMDEVVLQLQKATGCDIYKAIAIMMEAHAKGRAVCYRGDRDECHRVAKILREIRLQVEVDCD